MNSENKQKRTTLKNISIKLQEDQIRKLKEMGVTSFSGFFRELAQKWLDEDTSQKGSREDQLLILNHRADMAEKELESLQTDGEYRKCLKALEAADNCTYNFKNALFRIDVITDDTWQKYEHAGMRELSKLASELTREQWRKIAEMKSDPLWKREFFSETTRLLLEYQVKAVLNWRRNKIRVEAQEAKIEQARQRVRQAREEVECLYEETKKA